MNFAELFRVTLPETVLEITALIVLIVDLGFVRQAAFKTRVITASLLGVAGCAAALNALCLQARTGLYLDGSLILANSGLVTAAQIGILVMTALTLLLLICSTYTRHVGEFVSLVLMSASGALLVSAARDLLVIFVGL